MIGAVDFNDWKNGIVCSGRDAKVLEAKSGMEDDDPHYLKAGQFMKEVLRLCIAFIRLIK